MVIKSIFNDKKKGPSLSVERWKFNTFLANRGTAVCCSLLLEWRATLRHSFLSKVIGLLGNTVDGGRRVLIYNAPSILLPLYWVGRPSFFRFIEIPLAALWVWSRNFSIHRSLEWTRDLLRVPSCAHAAECPFSFWAERFFYLCHDSAVCCSFAAGACHFMVKNLPQS